jgi:hypothetical protein
VSFLTNIEKNQNGITCANPSQSNYSQEVIKGLKYGYLTLKISSSSSHLYTKGKLKPLTTGFYLNRKQLSPLI